MSNKLKVFISPQYNNPDNGDGGIRRVVEAQRKYLGDYGVTVVDDLGKADLTVGHVDLVRRKGIPAILCSHGAMWADYPWGTAVHQVNAIVRDGMIQADAITVPSVWVHRAITRSILRSPTIIYHGIDADEWKHNKRNGGYVLWDKARMDWVSNPREMQKLAAMMPDIEFRSTMGEDTMNVKILGRKPHEQMKPIVQRAGVYLATARETFGISILQALASGVPVAGWDYGGQREIIRQGETGYLAPYGDYDALAECVRKSLTERDRLSQNAVQDVYNRWLWADKIQAYAQLFECVVSKNDNRPKVSIIVTCHNLGRYLPHALDSVLEQTLKDWECIIVDDQSHDLTQEISLDYKNKDRRIHYYRTEKNLGLCGALNFGFSKSTGLYVINLDADNLLTPKSLEIQAKALDDDPTIHIVSGDLDMINHDGGEKRSKIWHNKDKFDWRAQLAHINQIHSGSMMRREVREETGGYRERYWRAEDAHFWTLATSYGFRAKIVTDYPTMVYRFRNDSKSAHEYSQNQDKDGDWTIDFPYRLAGNPQDGVRMLAETKGIPNVHTVPFAAQGEPTINGGLCWNVYHHEAPLVSIIIPMGAGHERLVIDALDSLQSQDFINWESIVVNDSGKPLAQIPGHPYARIVSTKGKEGPAKARNVGIQHARGELVYFLDADDMFMPGATLRKMIEAYALSERSYIYTNYIKLQRGEHSGTLVQLFEYDYEVAGKPLQPKHGINILIAKEDLLKVGMLDDSIPGWEDWDLYCKLKVNGYCGKLLDIPGFIYRFNEGKQREMDFERRAEIMPKLKARYNDYDMGVKNMAGCCPGGGQVVLDAKAELHLLGQLAGDNSLFRTEPMQTFDQKSGLQDKPVRMEFIGERFGEVTYFGKEGREYRGGKNPSWRYADVNPMDVEKLELTGDWRIIQVQPQAVEPVISESIKELPMQSPIMITETKQDEVFPEPDNVLIATTEKAKTKRKTTTKTISKRKAKSNGNAH